MRNVFFFFKAFFFFFARLKEKKRSFNLFTALILFLQVPAMIRAARTPRPCLTLCAGAAPTHAAGQPPCYIHGGNGVLVTLCSDPNLRDLPKFQHSSREAGDLPWVYRDLTESRRSRLIRRYHAEPLRAVC